MCLLMSGPVPFSRVPERAAAGPRSRGDLAAVRAAEVAVVAGCAQPVRRRRGMAW